MDYDSLERLVLTRHLVVAGRAEDRARLTRDLPEPRLAGWLAARLRGLADRIDRNPNLEPHLSGGTRLISNGPF